VERIEGSTRGSHTKMAEGIIIAKALKLHLILFPPMFKPSFLTVYI
jgi:hypothetical protein